MAKHVYFEVQTEEIYADEKMAGFARCSRIGDCSGLVRCYFWAGPTLLRLHMTIIFGNLRNFISLET